MTESKPTEEAPAEPADPSTPAPVPPPPAGAPSSAPERDGNGDASASEPSDPAPKPGPKKKKKKAREEDAGPPSAAADPHELLAKGNPIRRLRGGLTTIVASFLTFLLMAENGQLRVGVPVGILLMAVATFGVMDFLGSFDDDHTHVATRTTLASLSVSLATTAATLALYALAIAGASSGMWSQGFWGVVVTLTFLGLVASVFDLGVKLGPWKKDELGLDRPLFQREGFWVIVAAAGLMLPCLGSYSLWDPWETHYGEVAREVLARDDWISLWWAQDGWFWSKPILDFWIQAIFMATMGVHYKPDQMLDGVGGATAHPEWAVRTPVFLLTVVAMYLIYKGVAKVFGRRAGLLGGLVLATMPDWYFLGHQTMTDMPCIAPMTSAMGLLLLGLNTDADQRAKVYEVKVGSAVLRFSGWHLVFGSIVIVALPQIVYLLSRNIELVVHGQGPHGFRPHLDEFRSGSGGGNCGLPGNEACTTTASASIPASVRSNADGFFPSIWRFVGAFEPGLQAAVWSGVLSVVLYLNWGERRVRRLYYLAAWFFAAIATMGKGPEGFALPMLCTFVYVCVTKRWAELLRFELLSGLLIILAVALPWYVASYVRHGSPFTDRLIFHDMFNRAFHHVHDTNEGDDTSFRFYIWQLGYALFPWTGLSALGLVFWLRRPDAADEGRGDASVLLAMWFLFGFALFSFMGTKFHHYVFPCVPPVAMLLGITFDSLLGPAPLLASDSEPTAPARKGSGLNVRLLIALGVVALGVALLVAGVECFAPGSWLGTRPSSGLSPPSFEWGGALAIAGGGILFMALKKFRSRPTDGVSAPAGPASHERLMVAGAAASGALLLGVVGRDLILKPDNADQPGAIRLLQLFTYNYRRAWPDSLDFSAILTGFTVIAVALGLAFAVSRLRRPVTVALFALGVVWAVWGLDVYMVKTAPHWGQHEVIQAYYDNRRGPEEPLIAYQMNWKGENFYTGNRIPAFVSSGATFTSWLKQQREKGVKIMYFITEHGRIGGLKGEVAGKNYREVTDKVLNNKFVLVRAEL